MSSLSHSITCRSAMAAGSIGTRSSSRSRVSTKPPGCCPRWRGKPISSRASSSVSRRRRSARLRLSSAACSRLTPSSRPAPDLAGQGAGHVLGQAQRLADIAHRAAGAVADDGGAERGAVAAVGVIDPLDHLLAPLVLEIDVDVRRLAPLGRDEALEQQAGADRVDGGDAKDVADGASWPPNRGPGRGYPWRGRSGRWCGRSGNRARSPAPRSAAARDGAAPRRRPARRPGSARRAPSQISRSSVCCGVSAGSSTSSGYW